MNASLSLHRQPPDSPGRKLLSVIIPAFNEEATIEKVLEMVTSVDLDLDLELLVINDGSADRTPTIAREWAARNQRPWVSVHVIDQANGGKGVAVRRGIDASSGDFVVVQDADLEYDPGDYPKLLAPLVAGEAEVCYGSRILGPDTRGGLLFYLGGRVVTFVTNLLYGSRLTDEPTCYKAFRGELIRAIPLTCRGFEFCPEVTAKVLKRGIPIVEVPIRYRPRGVREGKKIRFRDGVLACWELLKWRLRR